MFKKIHNYWLEHIQPRIVRFLLFVTRGDFLYISIALVLTVVIIIWAIKSQSDWNNVVELSTFSAVVLEGALVAVVGLLRSLIQGFTEDPEKLTDDYDNLVKKRYPSEPNLVWTRNKEGGLTVFPVVHVAWLYDKKITVDDHPENEYVLPEIIDEHYEELYNTHQTSKIFNNTNVRVDDWQVDKTGHEFQIITGRTSYYSSLVTNRAMDYEIKKGITVRELLECGPMVHPLRYSKLSNHLGFNGFVETSDHKIIFIKRKKNVSIGKRTWGDSVGASLKAKYALDEHFHFREDGLYNAIVREIEDELGIQSLSLEKTEDNQRVRILAAYRDMLEGGKPQLLFYARTSMSYDELKQGFKQINKKSFWKKSYNREDNEVAMETDGFEMHPISRDDLMRCEVYPDKIIHSDFVMKMLPSASACVSLFAMYLKSQHASNPSLIPSFGLQVVEDKLVGKMGNENSCEDGLKGDENTCEDGIFSGKRFVAVIDGVTAKTDKLFEKKTPGRMATEIILDTFSQLDNMALKYTDTPAKVINVLSDALASEMKRLHVEDPDARFKASIIYFDRSNKTVVSYGDCRCRIGDVVHEHNKKIDDVLAEKRAEILRKALGDGSSVESLRRDDIGRAAIIDEMKEYAAYENRSDSEYGYPVLNGGHVNESMIQVYTVNEGEPVILCSDGYPQVGSSLEESEAALKEILKDDPLLIGNNLCGFKTTKACIEGNASFDDRAWVKFG